MAGDHDQAVQNSEESDAPTRRQFLGAAGIAAAGVTLLGRSNDVSAMDPAAKAQRAALVTTLPVDFLRHTHNPRPTCVAATADGTSAVSTDDKGQIFQWTFKPVAWKGPAFTKPRKSKASFVTISKPQPGIDPKVLVASYDGIVSVYTLGTDHHRLGVFDDHLAENVGRIEVWAVAVLNDGTIAISSTNSGEIRLWDVDGTHTMARTDATDEPVASLAFLPDQGDGYIRFLAGYGDGTMAKWRYSDAKGLETEGNPFVHHNAVTVNSIAVFKNSGHYYAITGSFDSCIRIWDLSKPPNQDPIKYRFQDHFIWRVAASPDGNTLAAVSEDGNLPLQIFAFDGSPKNYAAPPNYGIMGVDFLDNSNVVITTKDVANQAGTPPEVSVVPFT